MFSFFEKNVLLCRNYLEIDTLGYMNYLMAFRSGLINNKRIFAKYLEDY